MPTHKCLSGETITYPDPEPNVAAYLAKAQAMATDLTVDMMRMNRMVYGKENPLLDNSSGRPVVTRAAYDNPIYRILREWIEVKEVNLGLIDPIEEAAEYTLSLAEAAERLGITAAAVRAAIRGRKLAGWMRNGQWYVRPDSVAAYKPSKRGRHNARPRGAG